MLKTALPALCCLLVMLGYRAFAGEPCLYLISVSPDTLPTDLRDRVLLSQPALKQAVILAVNQRAGPDSMHAGISVPDSIPFNKLGLSGMNTSAKGAFTQYLESGKSTAGIIGMRLVI